VCSCKDFEVVLPGGTGSKGGLANLARSDYLADVPLATVAELDLGGCRWCEQPRRQKRRRGSSSLRQHETMSEPLAPSTMAVWRNALSLLPRATPDLATAMSVAAAFPDELKEAAACGVRLKAPPKVTRKGVAAAIREARRRKAPSPSGLRVKHLWALDAEGRDALVGVVSLLAGEASARLPACAAAAHAGTSLLLLRKPGGVGADGVPKPRPIGMPKALRRLAASALSAAVRAPAAALFAPLQLGVGVSRPCERILHQVHFHMAAHHEHAVIQLDYRNAFNLVSRSAAAAVLGAALPVLSPYLQSVYGGDTGGAAPNVYGWAEDAGAGTAADSEAAAADARGGAAGCGGGGGVAAGESGAARRGGGPGTAASGAGAIEGGGEKGGGVLRAAELRSPSCLRSSSSSWPSGGPIKETRSAPFCTLPLFGLCCGACPPCTLIFSCSPTTTTSSWLVRPRRWVPCWRTRRGWARRLTRSLLRPSASGGASRGRRRHWRGSRCGSLRG